MKRRNKGVPVLDVLALLLFPSGNAGAPFADVGAQAFRS